MLDSILLPSTRTSPSPRVWFGTDVDGALTRDAIDIQGYQLYAVEKWIVDRSRPTHVLLVYTGDHSHKITAASFAPSTQADYEKAVHRLRRDGARPKQTVHGVLMVTSLAHFRSDYTIVKIPNGDYLAVKDQLYANINLLRMGCSGRSALSLDEPSEPTKERFLSAYHLRIPSVNIKSSEHLPLPSSSPSTKNLKKVKDRALFTATVLELVKLIQAGLAIFAHYGSLSPPSPSVLLDGLLCDQTVEGIHRWIADIGEPCLGLEPTERVADPSFVSALLSMVLAIRNKLAALVASSASSSAAQLMPVPKDPFVYPYAFSLSLMSYLQHASANSPVAAAFHTTTVTPFIVSGFAPPIQSSLSTANALPIGAVLSREIVEHIDSTYDRSKSSDNRRVRRVLKGNRAVGDSEGDDSHSHLHPSVIRDKRGALSDGEAHLLGGSPVNSVGSSSGNRVLGGIGTLLLPGNTSLSTSLSPSGSGGAGSITAALTNLSTFLSVALSKEAGSSSFSTGRRGTNLKRMRGRITGVSASAAGDHSVRMGMGKSLGVGMAIGKSKRQRESVDMGYFYSGAALAGSGGGVILGGLSMGGPGVDAVMPNAVEKDRDMEKEVVVGGSIKALWGGRVLDLVKMREWCEEVAQSHQLGDSALVLPSSNYLLGTASHRAVSGSTLSSQHSAALNVKEKVKKLKDKAKESEKSKLPASLLSVHSDADFKSDAGRSTEGEESESIYPSASNTPLLHPETLNPVASASFGSLLGGRVRGKLGNWANLTKRKGQSVDFSASTPHPHLNAHGGSLPTSSRTSPVLTRKDVGSGISSEDQRLHDDKRRPGAQIRVASAPLITTSLTRTNRRQTPGASPSSSGANTRPELIARQSTNNTSSGPQSPTLPPMVYPGEEDVLDGEQEALSSGQISPLSDNKLSYPLTAPRSLGQLSRNFSLSLPPSQRDRNFLSVSTINEKLSRLSADQRNADNSSIIPSARSSNTNLHLPLLNNNVNQRRKMFLYPPTQGELTGNEDGKAEDSAGGSRFALQRPRAGYGRSMSSTTIPRVSSWSDPLSARYLIGAASSHIEPLDLGGRSDDDDEVEEEEGDAEREGDRGLGGIESEGDIISDWLVSKPLSRPSIQTRRTEFARTGKDDEGGNNSSRERKEKEKPRFHSLLSVVDQDGNYFLEEPMGSWDQAQYSYDPDEKDGLYPYDWDMDEDDLVAGTGVDLDDKEWVQRRRRRRGGILWYDPLRRRSFQDLDDFYDMPVLYPEWMRMDVEMCGQVLVMLRREEHLRNVVACLEILNSSLSSANGLLRKEYESHMISLSQLPSRTKILADLDQQSTRTDNLSQQTNILRYEAEQFHVPSLYHAASLSRQKVLEMRHKVFGVHKVFDASSGPASADVAGGLNNKSKNGSGKKKKGTGHGRVLPEGVRGAHGKFNRLQKRLDGQEVVVDWLGRTESEADEEERLARNGMFSDGRRDPDTPFGFGIEYEDEAGGGAGALGSTAGEGEEGDVVEHSSIRPMWLLRFFMGWGARWSARAAAAVQSEPSANQSEKDDVQRGGEQER